MTNACTSPPGGRFFPEKKSRHRHCHGQTHQQAEHEKSALRRRRLRARGRLVGQELDPGVGHIVKALHGIFHEAPAQDITHTPRRLGGESFPRDVFMDHVCQHVRDGLAVKRFLSGDRLEEHAAERPDVRALVCLLTSSLLRAHVGRGPHDDPDRGSTACESGGGRQIADRLVGCKRFREAKVENFNPPFGCDLDVRRLQVTMHNTRRVRRFERFRDLVEDRNGLFDRERATGEPFLKSLAMYELHHQVHDGTFRLQPVERRDARVIQRRRERAPRARNAQAAPRPAATLREGL